MSREGKFDSYVITNYYLQANPPTEEDMAATSDFDYKKANSIYDFTVKDTYGNDVSLEKYRGYVVVIVNIASQCGLTKNNYAKLTQLKNNYYDKGKFRYLLAGISQSKNNFL